MVLMLVTIGAVAGILSGLFGIGGGLLIVPALVIVAHFHFKLAIGTSLGALLLPVGALGVYAYHQNGHLDLRASLLIGLGLFFGAWVEIENEQGETKRFRIVGYDEIYERMDYISIDSPMARALLRKDVDDEALVQTPSGEVCWWITAIAYVK